MNQEHILKAINNALASMDRPKAWLCEQIGVSNQVFNNWVKRGIPESRLSTIADVFGWDVDELRRGRVVTVSDELVLPLYEIQASMGDGSAAHEQAIDPVVSLLKVARKWASTTFSSSSLNNLALITATGNSMSPTFSDGDTVIIDKGINTLEQDGVYVLLREDNLFIKRLERMLNGEIQVSSDNPEHKPYTISKTELGEIRILGKALWALTGKSL